MKHVLIFANGDVLDGPMVRRALDQAVEPFIIAADGGARVADYFGLPIERIIGDMDSIQPDRLERLAADGADVQRYPPEKDYTDLELALRSLDASEARWVRIIGGLGDRFDQTLANVYLLALPSLADGDVRIVAGRQELRLLRPGEHRLRGTPGDTVSLIPVGGPVYNVYTEALQYPLRGETLEFGPARGISNRMTQEQALINTDDGLLLLVHTVGEVE